MMRGVRFLLKALLVLVVTFGVALAFIFPDMTKPLMNRADVSYTITSEDGHTRSGAFAARSGQNNFADGGSCAEPFNGVITATLPAGNTYPDVFTTLQVIDPDTGGAIVSDFGIKDADADWEMFESFGAPVANSELTVTRGWFRWRFDGALTQELRSFDGVYATIDVTISGAAQATWTNGGILAFDNFCMRRAR